MDNLIKNLKLFIAIILVAEGAVIVRFPPAIATNNPAVPFVAMIMAIIGFCYLLFYFFSSLRRKRMRRELDKIRHGKARGKAENKSEKKKGGKPEANLATKLMTKLTLNNRLTPYLPALGIVVIVMDLVYNAFYNGWSMVYTDTTALLFGGVLIAYRYFPEKYAWERDFLMLFSMVLIVILIFPLMLTRALRGDPDANVNMYSSVMLGPPLIFILNIIGISSYDGPPPPGPGNTGYPWIYYTDSSGIVQRVGISASCSGLYSFAIFAGLFTAYVLVQYSRLDLKIGVMLILGFLTSYFANLLRMAIIIMAGYYYGPGQVVMLTHEYIGFFIFAVWLAIFWFFLLKYMRSGDDMPRKEIAAEDGFDDEEKASGRDYIKDKKTVKKGKKAVKDDDDFDVDDLNDYDDDSDDVILSK
jgi:exosortase/archaeosortase family protein